MCFRQRYDMGLRIGMRKMADEISPPRRLAHMAGETFSLRTLSSKKRHFTRSSKSTFPRPSGMKTTTFFMTMFFAMLLSGVVSGQEKPTTGYAPVNGLRMYYEIHGSGEPVVLLHGAFMAISNNFHWTEWIGELSKTRKVIAIE